MSLDLCRFNSILQRQSDLRSRNWCWYLVKTRRLDVVAIPVDLQAKLPRLSIDDTPHPVGATQRLVSLQAVPRVASDSIIPPGSELREPGVLRFELKGRDLLHGILVLVPLDADVVDGLLVQVLKKLCAELVGDLVVHVEVAVEL